MALGRVFDRPASLAFVLLAACTPSTGSPDAGSPPVTCSSNAECSGGFVCDSLRRVCVCTSDATCQKLDKAAPYCNAFTGRCVADIAGCKSDAQCGSGKFCDISLRTCRSKKGWCQTCAQDAECGGPADRCVHHPSFPDAPTFCATACGSNGACPSGQACVTTDKGKQCIPAQGLCNSVAACVPDSDKPCSSSADCTDAGQACDRSLGLCVASQPSCPQGEACDSTSHQCVAGCTSDAECQARFADPTYVCRNYSCVKGNACRADADCRTDQWCAQAAGAGATDTGVCSPSCAGDADCPLGELCGAGSTGHPSCAPGCHDDSGCPLNAVCSGGQCQLSAPSGAQRCQAKEVCPFNDFCTGQVCVASSPTDCGSCSGGCGGGGCATMFASPTCNSALACPTGTSQKVCGQDSLIGLSCPPSHSACACKISRCLYRCGSDSDCPSGFYCTAADINGDQGPWCYPQVAAYCQ